jgi:hypothetical protein
MTCDIELKEELEVDVRRSIRQEDLHVVVTWAYLRREKRNHAYSSLCVDLEAELLDDYGRAPGIDNKSKDQCDEGEDERDQPRSTLPVSSTLSRATAGVGPVGIWLV